MKILVALAHPDDEVLGCGGSIAKWTSQGDEVRILLFSDGVSSRSLATDSPTDVSSLIAKRQECAKRAANRLGVVTVEFLNFPDNQMDSLSLLKVVQPLEEKLSSFMPDMVVTHHVNDLNVDHQITHKAIVTACRPQPHSSVKRILACEIVSSTNWQNPSSDPYFTPNWYVDISDSLEIKHLALLEYSDELRTWPHSRSVESLRHLAMWRGATIGCQAAEAFMLIRNID
tara:strand:- start:536 stop:1222 length:687 start_codon:yes stop_codon:yes gene_type:complete